MPDVGLGELDDMVKETPPDATAPVLWTDAYLLDLIPASLVTEDVLDPVLLHRERVSHRNVPDVSDPDLRVAGCQPVSKPSLEARHIDRLEHIRALAGVQFVNLGAQRGEDGLITEHSEPYSGLAHSDIFSSKPVWRARSMAVRKLQ